MALRLSNRAGKLAYGALFTLAVPLGLWLWNRHLSCPFPAVHSPWLGTALLTSGGWLMLLAMWRLWQEGGGLPMNAFPPPRVVTRGVYAWVPHPIYCGFIAACAGAALLSNSATGLWIVTPVVALACLALVLGYEGPDLRRRFGPRLPTPWLGLPSGEGFLPLSRRVGTALAVLLPWALCYWAVKALGVPAGAVETRLSWEWAVPVLPATMPVYASIYLVVPLTFLLCADRADMRHLAVSAWTATALNTLLYVTVPATAAFRPAEAQDWMGQWLAWEQRLALPAAGSCPSFHITWAVLCAAFLARGPLRRTPVLGWLWCLGLGLSCLTTGMHSLVDVLAGALAGALCVRPDKLWKQLLKGTEHLSNAWKAWQVGPLRVINHSLWAGLAGFTVLVLAGQSADSQHLGWIVLVACCALMGAGLWAQWVEGSSALLRPFGYYGAILGGLFALAVMSWVQGPVADLMAAFAVAAPWSQAIGRLRCVVQGCCHGRPVAWGIRITNPHSRVVKLAGFSGTPIHPTPLYSILTNVVIGILLLRLRLGGAGPFQIAGLYLLLAGLSRFVEEAYRGEPQTWRFAGLPLYQWMAVGSLVFG
ncbi:MAG TPA: prolipoprotein diacylglyceryl transferase family protein, partial [Bacillota bacterium]|nr:prolipoprotein diacylglyceryl transferase family protein [Bacillota bacterium]